MTVRILEIIRHARGSWCPWCDSRLGCQHYEVECAKCGAKWVTADGDRPRHECGLEVNNDKNQPGCCQ